MTMMFEVEDLEVASPATVSRCGMVYMEPVALGMKPIVDSWLQQLLPNLTKLIKPKLNTLFDKYIYSLQKYVRLQVREVQPTRDNNLVASLTHILDCFLENYRETEARKITGEDLENLSATIEAIFMFALTWSFGCTGDSESRDKFNLHIKELTDVFPAEGTIYDYYFDTTERQFVAWNELFKEFEINNNHQYHEIMIPNVDSTRNTYLTTMLVQQGYHVLCPGPTGTGKSMNIYAQLNQMGDNYQYIAITFSAQTSAN
jgi:dynein heavy chain, axonemal